MSDAPRISSEPLRYKQGDVIGSKYRLDELIGEGGMGSVWRARNTSLDVDVAVKLIRRDRASDELAERLQKEAHAAALLEHPSVVRVFDFGETDLGDPFIAMEILRGDSLGEVLERKGKLPAPNVVQLLLPVASALAAAHAKGIVHRDLKPDNIVLVTDETGLLTPKVVDFGIAKIHTHEDSRATRDGTVMGSPEYMSPEQARGLIHEIDHRTDIWALGVVLYEALTGRAPFDAPNVHALLFAIMEDDPIPTHSVEAGDEALWKILARALAKDRDQRWPDMRSFGKALARWAATQNITMDITGTALAAQWGETARSPLSDSPAADADSARLFVGDIKREIERERKSRDAKRPSTTRPSKPQSSLRPSRQSGARTAPPPAKRRLGMRHFLIGGLALAVGVWIALPSNAPLRDKLHIPKLVFPKASASAAASAAPPLHVEPARTGTPASASAPASSASAAAPPTAAPSGNAAPLAPPKLEDVDACVRAVFPPDTFMSDDTAFSFVCEERDPRQGAVALESEIVRAGQNRPDTTKGMKQWAMLSWYEMAVFAVARGRCCPELTEPLTLPHAKGVCPPLAEALNELATATRIGESPHEPASKFRKAVACIDRSQTAGIYDEKARVYGYVGAPSGAAEPVFRRFLKRGKRH